MKTNIQRVNRQIDDRQIDRKTQKIDSYMIDTHTYIKEQIYMWTYGQKQKIESLTDKQKNGLLDRQAEIYR